MTITEAKCNCQHCNQSIYFDADQAGQNVECPYCGLETLLFIPPVNQELPIRTSKPWKFICIAILLPIVIASVLLAGAIFAREYLPAVAEAGANILGFIISLLITAVVAALYFLPSIIAWQRKKANWRSIMVINIFLGWTLLGWVGALVWAFLAENKMP